MLDDLDGMAVFAAVVEAKGFRACINSRAGPEALLDYLRDVRPR